MLFYCILQLGICFALIIYTFQIIFASSVGVCERDISCYSFSFLSMNCLTNSFNLSQLITICVHTSLLSLYILSLGRPNSSPSHWQWVHEMLIVCAFYSLGSWYDYFNFGHLWFCFLCCLFALYDLILNRTCVSSTLPFLFEMNICVFLFQKSMHTK